MGRLAVILALFAFALVFREPEAISKWELAFNIATWHFPKYLLWLLKTFLGISFRIPLNSNGTFYLIQWVPSIFILWGKILFYFICIYLFLIVENIYNIKFVILKCTTKWHLVRSQCLVQLSLPIFPEAGKSVFARHLPSLQVASIQNKASFPFQQPFLFKGFGVVSGQTSLSVTSWASFVFQHVPTGYLLYTW